MDFSNFNACAAADTARSMHLRHPVSGDLMYANDNLEKPCRVLVRGMEGREVQKRLLALNQAKMNGSDDEKTRMLAEVHAEMVDKMYPLVAGFENIENGKAALTDTPDDIKWFLNLQLIGLKREDGDDLSFLGQVISFAAERGNYLGNASTA